MKQLLVVGIAICLFYYPLMPSAQALEIEALGVFTSTGQGANPNPFSNGSVTYSIGSCTGFGGGADLIFDLAPAIELEAGVFLLPRGFSSSASGTTVYDTYPTANLPVTVQFAPTKSVSVGIGGYYAVLQSATVTSVSSAGTTQNYLAGYATNETGLIAEAKYNLALAPMLHFTLGAQYYFGLTNNNVNPTLFGTTSSFYTRDFVVLTGLGISI